MLYFYYGFQAADLAGLGKELAPVGVKGTSGCHLEASGPLNLVLAQGLYLIQPLFSAPVSRSQLGTLAGTLENSEETQMFVTFLRRDFLP